VQLPADFTGPKITFETNHGKKVIPFAPSVHVSISASEALGRPYSELTLEQFQDFFGFPPDDEEEPVQKRAKIPRKIGRDTKGYRELMALFDRAKQDGAIAQESRATAASRVFQQEVVLMKERFSKLAMFVLELAGGGP